MNGERHSGYYITSWGSAIPHGNTMESSHGNEALPGDTAHSMRIAHNVGSFRWENIVISCMGSPWQPWVSWTGEGFAHRSLPEARRKNSIWYVVRIYIPNMINDQPYMEHKIRVYMSRMIPIFGRKNEVKSGYTKNLSIFVPISIRHLRWNSTCDLSFFFMTRGWLELEKIGQSAHLLAVISSG